MNLVDMTVKDQIKVLNVGQKKLNIITRAGPGEQNRLKVGYDCFSSDGTKHPMAANMTGALGLVSGYTSEIPEFQREPVG